jgi:hypothetical protein
MAKPKKRKKKRSKNWAASVNKALKVALNAEATIAEKLGVAPSVVRFTLRQHGGRNAIRERLKELAK